MEFGFEGFDPENPNDRPQPGKYHILIQGVDESDPSKSIAVDYEILSGTVKGMEGKTNREYLSRSAKSEKRLALFVLATKLTTTEQMIDAKRTGKRLALDLTQAEGRQICVELVKSKDGQFVNWSFAGIWALDAPEAKDIPKNNGMVGQTAEGDPLQGVNF
jgi:hypothetical protein